MLQGTQREGRRLRLRRRLLRQLVRLRLKRVPGIRPGKHTVTQTDILRRSADELLQLVEKHRGLLCQLQAGDTVEAALCPLMDCPRRRRLKGAILHAIEVLEGTRRSFKSKQLETLRKDLMGVLAESG